MGSIVYEEALSLESGTGVTTLVKLASQKTDVKSPGYIYDFENRLPVDRLANSSVVKEG